MKLNLPFVSTRRLNGRMGLRPQRGKRFVLIGFCGTVETRIRGRSKKHRVKLKLCVLKTLLMYKSFLRVNSLNKVL